MARRGNRTSGSRIADYELASPMNHISHQTPPLLLIYGGAGTQVGIETADRFVVALNQAGLKDVSYHRLATVDHCPYSLIRVSWLIPSIDEFFLRTLRRQPTSQATLL
jgi:dipeptidyl aminopeptidase/acylaminoacyl peptidase